MLTHALRKTRGIVTCVEWVTGNGVGRKLVLTDVGRTVFRYADDPSARPAQGPPLPPPPSGADSPKALSTPLDPPSTSAIRCSYLPGGPGVEDFLGMLAVQDPFATGRAPGPAPLPAGRPAPPPPPPPPPLPPPPRPPANFPRPPPFNGPFPRRPFEAEFRRLYNVEVVGHVKNLRQQFYAISVIGGTTPRILASQGSRREIFTEPGHLSCPCPRCS